MTETDFIDGRTARRNRNRDAVLDSLIQLASEGDAEPAIETIADRAGVSYRSVYRYFDDRTDLMLAAIARQMEDVWPMLRDTRPVEGTLDERIAQLVQARLAHFHRLAPLTRVAVHRRAHEPAVVEQYDLVRDQFRERLVRQFQPELAAYSNEQRKLVVAALDLAFQFESIDYLARHDEMSDDDISRLLTRHVHSHLGVIENLAAEN